MSSTLSLSADVNNLKKCKFPTITKPRMCGYFSIDENRQYVPDDSNLSYLYLEVADSQPVRFDLNKNMDCVIRKESTLNDKEKLVHLLTYILHNYNKHVSDIDSMFLQSDFICYRGLMTILMCTPFNNEEWIICASLYKGNIYLWQHDTDSKRLSIINATKRDKMFCSWGYKFEQYMLTDIPKKKPNTSEPVNENNEFCCVFESKLNGLTILYGAEMDGIKSQTPIDIKTTKYDSLEFIELKTSKRIETHKQDNNFKRYKIIKWWCQSFLVGISDIICGFRDDNGIVHEVKKFNIKELPKLGAAHWDAGVCMNFCDQFLHRVKETITNEKSKKDDPFSVWKFEYKPNEKNVYVKKINDRSEFTFLPDWYIETVDKIHKKK